jgi:hypothetical protein
VAFPLAGVGLAYSPWFGMTLENPGDGDAPLHRRRIIAAGRGS